MQTGSSVHLCWIPFWNEAHPGVGMEHLMLSDHAADSVVLGIDPDEGPFRLFYQLGWAPDWCLRKADLRLETKAGARSLSLLADGAGHWRLGDGTPRPELDGCIDIDIWPTPFTNSFPIRRERLVVGERRTFRMAWVSALEMSVQAQPQAYTRLQEDVYRFENLDGSGFKADLRVDNEGVVVEYPGLFKRA
ncbi:MAG: hypothetical protein EON92_05615 [Burkholderiales bacterium]|nr:MAG: hypothetical protein EON92_05615 [Burkholderiales bacterium]